MLRGTVAFIGLVAEAEGSEQPDEEIAAAMRAVAGNFDRARNQFLGAASQTNTASLKSTLNSLATVVGGIATALRSGDPDAVDVSAVDASSSALSASCDPILQGS